MNPQIKKRLIRTAILCAFALVIGAGMGLMQVKSRTGSAVQKPGQSARVPGIKVGGDFTLVNQDGKTVTQDEYAGQYKLIYFGFTFCPAICPTELQKMTQALKIMGEDGKNIQPLFITVDPERDTVPVMKDYVAMFSPDLDGLTGTVEQIEKIKQDYRVYAQKVKTEEMTEYTMDHSSFIYLMNTNNELVSIYRTEDNAAFMAEDLKIKMSAS
jgi:protein SCO1/2